MNFIQYIESWEKQFKDFNKRNPTHTEKMAFRVGFNWGKESAESVQDTHNLNNTSEVKDEL